jgi:hypothetical protein
MNVGLRQLRAFLAVAKHGSFSHAAEEVYLQLPHQFLSPGDLLG